MMRTDLLLSSAFTYLLIAGWTHAGAPVPGREAPGVPPNDVIELSGRIVDERTGLPVTIFAMQWGEARDLSSEIKWVYGLTVAITPHRDGWFHISRPFPAGRKVSLRILADGYVPQPITESLMMPVRIDNLVVRLRTGIEVRGTVVDHLGQPMDSAQVYLTGNQELELEDGVARVFRGSTATTDSAGEFVLTGADPSSSPSVVVSANHGRLVAVVRARQPLEKLFVRLPEPARLLIRFDMPGAASEGKFHLDFESGESKEWLAARVRMSLSPTIRNSEEIELILMPGTYHFSRGKIVDVGDFGRGFVLGSSDIVLEPGETRVVEVSRYDGHSIVGDVLGLKDSGAVGAFVTVRAADATGDPRNSKETTSVFDATSCNAEDGHFETEPLSPGVYSIVVEAYLPETPEQSNSTGLRLPDFVGTAKVSITPDGPIPPVVIGLRPLIKRSPLHF